MRYEFVLARGSRKPLAAIATLAAAVAVSAVLPSASVAALPSGCSQSGQTVTCTYTSGSNPFIVPSGVGSLHVVAVGGAGGVASGGVSGGHGAVVTGNIPTNPGETVYAVVGTNGGSTGFSDGGDGGGASDVRTSRNELSSRLLVAAGGGGGGGNGFAFLAPDVFSPSPGGAGGAGGGRDGESPPGLAPGGGRGGSGTAGGAGGAGQSACLTFPVPPPVCGAGTDGGAGSSGVGGAGGAGASFGSPTTLEYVGGNGGGGGGGLFGGGGGGGGQFTQGGGGGGGGSNLMPPGGSQSIDTTGVPLVQISYAAVPTSEDQCKHGGWRNFPQFQNQGECVAFVEHAAISTCLAERASIAPAAFRDKYGVGRRRRHALRRCVQLHGG